MTLEFFESRTVFLAVGEFRIYWYGVMYVVAFWAAWFSLPRLAKKRGIVLMRDQWTSIVAFGALGALLGGRIGYALFYEPMYFLESPGEIFQIWNGGMSSHGGFIGAVLGVWWATRRERASLRSVADLITVPVALGLALGRLGNIINQEFGVYPYYEAVGDVFIAVVCFLLLRMSVVSFPLPFWERERVRGVKPTNLPSSARLRARHLLPEQEKGTTYTFVFPIFLLLYSIQRFLLEYVRPQDFSLIFGMSRGQLLTIPILLIAVILLKNALKPRIH